MGSHGEITSEGISQCETTLENPHLLSTSMGSDRKLWSSGEGADHRADDGTGRSGVRHGH